MEAVRRQPVNFIHNNINAPPANGRNFAPKEFFYENKKKKENQRIEKYEKETNQDEKVKLEMTKHGLRLLAPSKMIIFITYGNEYLYKSNKKLLFTPGELTAITLHEIGHVYDPYIIHWNYYVEQSMLKLESI